MRLTNNVRNAIDQLGQALNDADSHNGGVIEKDRIRYAMRLLMDREDKDLALYKISVSWNVDDVLSLDNSLSFDECIYVLDSAKKYHDASIGINWDTLQCHIDDLVEAKKAPLLFGDVLKDLDDAMVQAGFNQTKQ